MHADVRRVLVHLAAGVGNVVLATPLLVALQEMGFDVDVWLSADYKETADLLRPWNVVRGVFAESAPPSFARYARIIAAAPPFYSARFDRVFARAANLVHRPPASLFYEDEQEYYLAFARALGYPQNRKPWCSLPISANGSCGVTAQTVVLAPGCKTGEMAAKRWPHFAELAECFADVALVGTGDDRLRADGTAFEFPAHVRSFIDCLSLRETAELLAGAGVVVANDSGLAHVAAAVGVPTIILFGPTPHQTLGPFPPNVVMLRQGLACEPCWFHSRFLACHRRLTCLEGLPVETVVRSIERLGIARRRANLQVSIPAVAGDSIR